MQMVTLVFVALSVATVDAMHMLPWHEILGPFPLYTNQQSGKCLKFIHNPRTGGTSLDSMNLHLPRGQRAYDSIMAPYLDRAAGSSLFPLETPGHLFDKAHGSELTDEGSHAAGDYYGLKYLDRFDYRYNGWMSRVTGLQQTCQDLHTPPQYDKRIQRWLAQPGCTSFCVVRDPLTRLLSTYKFRGFGDCSLASFEQWILDTFPMRESITYCHGYPQVEYVYSTDPQEFGKKYCDRVLRLENLTEGYNALMEEFQKPLRMTTHLFSTSDCDIDVAGLSKEAKTKVFTQYEADYKAFGYPPPAGL